jgi:hypothetical protein
MLGQDLTNLSLCYGIYRVGLSIHAPVGWVGAPRPVVEAPPGGPPPGGRRRAAAGWGGRPAQRKHRVADTAPTLDEQRRGSSSSSMAGGTRSGVARNRLADLREFPVEPVAILEEKNGVITVEDIPVPRGTRPPAWPEATYVSLRSAEQTTTRRISSPRLAFCFRWTAFH